MCVCVCVCVCVLEVGGLGGLKLQFHHLKATDDTLQKVNFILDIYGVGAVNLSSRGVPRGYQL